MRHRGAYSDKGRPFKTTAHLFDLHYFGGSAEAADPLVGEFLAFFGGILIEILNLINAGGNYPTDQPEEGVSTRSIEGASYARTGVFLEPEVFASAILFHEIQVRWL